ncbi:MAG: hypothetical protein KME13_18565 [Myxacorys californica WJT36-NPBG1]|jgi:hypothetical protein|nr:hypothetical protein [Myxacorys californica WJT36-NPBG1]
MRDPHVVWLKYHLETDASVSYNAPALEREYDLFSLHLANGVLMATMQQHFSSESKARSKVEEVLRAWELDNALRFEIGELQFIFEEASVIDRDPPPPGTPQVIAVSTAISATSAMSATLHVTRGQYPEPPTRFKLSPDVEVMWFRYQQHLEGKEPLQSMAYFCLTVIESLVSKGKRKRAADEYRIDWEVLDKLGDFTTTKGSQFDARKHNNDFVALSEAEENWMREAVKILIRRKAEYDYDPEEAHSLKLITMAGLPKLERN